MADVATVEPTKAATETKAIVDGLLTPQAKAREAMYKKLDATRAEDQDPALVNELLRTAEGQTPADMELRPVPPKEAKQEAQTTDEPTASDEVQAVDREAEEEIGDDPQALKAELKKLKADQEKIKQSTQKRIDEITAKAREAEAAAKNAAPKQPTIQDLDDSQLESMLVDARQGKYSEKDEMGQLTSRGHMEAVRVEKGIMAEIARREREGAEMPVKRQMALQQARQKSIDEVAKNYGKYMYTKDEKGNQVVDEKSPVAKRARELFNEWSNDPILSQHPDLPLMAVKIAVGEVSSNADFDSLRKIHKLEMENEKLKAKTRMDSGRPGGSAIPKPKVQTPETAAKDYVAEQIKLSRARRGVSAFGG